MDVVKYFFEEPAYLEALSPDLDPDARRRGAPALPLEAVLDPRPYYRGYLAGTDLAAGRVGLTAIRRAASFVGPLLDAFEAPWTLARHDRTATQADADAVAEALRDPAEVVAFAVAAEPLPPGLLLEAAGADRRAAIPALVRVMERAEVVLLPEPAHHGWDLSLFAPQPLRDRLVAAFRRHPAEGVRRLVLPYARARSEEKFYLEQWQLDALPDYVEEV